MRWLVRISISKPCLAISEKALIGQLLEVIDHKDNERIVISVT
ncbi:hypothetical protein IGB42_01831 [Andreprevotia sp. IGB-42]|nr:hypothetical protein [Andreprevotia sp. IGB-42]KAF0813480.1 hypothetical protein IGB42_01831 [Andreprevotia sp. IGB-42]